MRENKSLFVATGTGGPLFYSQWIDGLSSEKIDYSTGNLEVSLLNFHSTSIPRKFALKKREVIEVSFECEIAHTQTIEMSALKKIELNKIENIFLSLPFFIHQETDDLKIRLLMAWSEGFDNISWRDFSSGKSKSSWLNACSSTKDCILYNDDKIAPQNITLSGENIFCEEDFYCALGEAFFGVRGYIGKDLDGLYECLGLSTIAKNKKTKLTIKHKIGDGIFFDKFKDKLFFEKLKNIFITCNCEIAIDNF